jgi:choline monooxygenase
MQKPAVSEGATPLELLELRGNSSPVEFLNESIFFQREYNDKDQEQEPQLHCFLNRCPHNFFPMKLANDFTRSPYSPCPQHGLVVDSRGKFVSHPDFPSPTDEEQARLSLTEYSLMEWGELFFICRGEPIISFNELMREVNESVALMKLDQLQFAPMAGQLRVRDGNWKLHAGNYMDSLHIKYIHKAPGGLYDALVMDSYTTEIYRFSSLQWAYAKNPEHGFDPALLPGRFYHPQKRVFALWWFIFPNLTLNFYPWGLSINVYMPHPENPRKVNFLRMHYAMDAAKYRRKDRIWLSKQVDDEDTMAIRVLNANLRPGSHPKQQGLFGPSEIGPRWFQDRARETMRRHPQKILV